MQKLTCIFNFNLICFLTVLFSALPVRGMEALLQAEKYDAACLLTRLPDELLIETQSLKNSIKILMKLSTLCKDFNHIWTFEKIGNLCKKYSDDDKTEVAEYMVCFGYREKLCMPISILICAGLDVDLEFHPYPLLELFACRTNDVQLVELLFKHKANPNIKCKTKDDPVFFGITTVEMAQLFVDNGVDLQAISDNFRAPNILWKTIQGDYYSSELMKFYLDHHADVAKLNHRGECLLHALAVYFWKVTYYVGDYLKKCELLLDAISDMINLMNCYGITPTDLWMDEFNIPRPNSERCIALFRKRGGLTQQELWDKKRAEEKERDKKEREKLDQ